VSRLTGLTASLIDDAAVFPPGNAPLADAVKTYYTRRDTPPEAVVGPLLVPVGMVDELRQIVDPQLSLDVALIGDDDVAVLDQARHSLDDDPWIVLHHVELKLTPSATSPTRARAEVASLLDRLPFTVPAYVELPTQFDPTPALEVLAADGVERAKFRTGPFEVPPAPDLAHAISQAVSLGVPFKLTGGLHHPFPAHDAATNREHHGFLNALAATSLAVAGRSPDEIGNILTTKDQGAVLAAIDVSDAAQIRSSLRSYGSCDIDEPYHELLRLGLGPTDD
jgi:hypothetical protein